MILSATKIRDYKGCRRMYYLRYMEGLTPKVDAEVLRDGKSYHEKIEEIYTNGFFTPSGDKTDAMAMAYEKYIYPKFKVDKVEEWFKIPLNDKHTLLGRYDGLSQDKCIVEHKTVSSEINDEYVYDLQWNEQILCYMLANNTNKIYYTVCRKPTIRQRQNESEEEFIQRCCEWYDVDTESKIAVITIERTQEEIEKFKNELIELADEMEEVESKQRLYCNPNHCNMWNRRCAYASVCLNYNPDLEYVDFVRKEK